MQAQTHDQQWKAAEPGLPMDKIRVMVIDEHLAVRRALAARLAAFSHIDVVATARTFQEGLEKACECLPDVILLEVKGNYEQETNPVGEMNNALVGHPVGIIVLTSYADDDEHQAAIKAGAMRYLLKHIDSANLSAEIEAVWNEVANISEN
jgi:NarL family two-component system response regulator LiaR